jgi:rhodanese-related sulfurtransferase
MFNSVMMAEFEQLLRKGDLNVVDVREIDEFESGHIKGAEHIALGEIPTSLEKLDKSKEYHMMCLSGARSAMASKYLAQQGFKIVNVMGGMSAYRGDVEFGR